MLTGDHRSTNHFFSKVVSHFHIQFEILYVSTIYAFLNSEHEVFSWSISSKPHKLNLKILNLTKATHIFSSQLQTQ